MSVPFRQFPRKRGPISPLASAAPYISYWNQPVNQPLKARVPKRQQPPVRQLFYVATIVTSSSTIGGQFRVSLNPAIGDGFAEPVNQPLRARVPKRQQPQPPSRRYLITTANQATIGGQFRVSENPSTNPESWKQSVNEPLRARVPKRQQPQPPSRHYLITTSTQSTIGGQFRVTSNPAANMSSWGQPDQQPLRSRVPKRQMPQYPSKRFLVSSTNSSTIGGQFRVTANPSLEPVWKQPANQPLKARVPKRQQPQYPTRRFLPTTTTNSTIGGQFRVTSNPAANPSSWKQPANQPLKARVPKRQQPFAINKRFLVTGINQSTIGGQFRVAQNPSLEPMWKQPPGQPLRHRWLKRQQPQPPARHYLITTANQSTIGGQFRVASNPSLSPSWKALTNEPLRARVPKRQMPQYPSRRFLITNVNQSTINGQFRVTSNPGGNLSSWVHPTNQPLRSRVPKRQMPPYPSFRYLVTVSGLQSTIGGQFRVLLSVGKNVAIWKQPVNEPLRARVPKRQQPFAVANRRFLITAYALNSTIGGRFTVITRVTPSRPHFDWIPGFPGQAAIYTNATPGNPGWQAGAGPGPGFTPGAVPGAPNWTPGRQPDNEWNDTYK
jgi:hypothetical protein